ncbi:curli-like amyloid fiber formation chaperone CsgH [Marinilabilia rubra]|uniref:Uncharacterized protein n=1 Tax=Marinilabilia rubra TaxID=2162893 RepID=A0A2U2B3Z9_9BACT|nr:curli-like amyloid fiber formation chaperone CsgH [Marinilabilia rubra]PWD97791.1 hypothetical protein DDZ16_18910 [Marinilabilia rubra]
MLKFLFSILLLLQQGASVFSVRDDFSSDVPLYEAQITFKNMGCKSEFVGSFLNHTEIEIKCSYELSVLRKGKSGSSRSIQRGMANAKPEVATLLSKSSVNVGQNDYCFVSLKVWCQDMLIAKDSINIDCSSQLDLSLKTTIP